jgi:hypothetical protein
MRVAGLASVDITGIENINVTDHVPGHMAYRAMMPTLLSNAGWAVESLEYTEIEDPDPDNHDKRQRELLNEIEEARRQLDQQPEKKGFKAFFSRGKKATQKKGWETYDERNTRVLEGDEKAAEQLANEASESNVMFDVDAIRKEALALAIQRPGDLEEIKRHLSVREIQSTLPALRVELGSSSSPKSPPLPASAQWRNSFHGERSASEAGGSARPDLPQTKSYTVGDSSSPARGAAEKEAEEEEGNVTLEFEDDAPTTIRQEPRRSTRGNTHNWTTNSPNLSAAASDRGDTTPSASAYHTPLRQPTPEPSSSTTVSHSATAAALPSSSSSWHKQSATGPTSPAPPLDFNPDHNPWDDEDVDVDDPRYGREKEEVTMTF